MKIEEYLNYLNSFFYPFFATIITPAIISHFSHLKKTHYGIGFFPSASVITSTITCYHLKSNKFINFFPPELWSLPNNPKEAIIL